VVVVAVLVLVEKEPVRPAPLAFCIELDSSKALANKAGSTCPANREHKLRRSRLDKHARDGCCILSALIGIENSEENDWSQINTQQQQLYNKMLLFKIVLDCPENDNELLRQA